MKLRNIGGVPVEFELAPKMVVFSHGFGVQRDNRGMFTKICKNLPDGYGYVLFDYNDLDEEHHTVRLTDFTEQVRRLQKVLAWTEAQKGVESVSIIAHSMGCIVIALAKPQRVNKIILLAPPTSIGEHTRQHFTAKKDAEKQDDLWLVPRSDGTISIIPETLFDQYEAVDAEVALQALADHRPYILITAEADEVLADAAYEGLAANPHIRHVGIEGANHDFEGDSRKQLLHIVAQTLQV